MKGNIKNILKNTRHPVITNKPPKNTALNMASQQGKDASESNKNKPAPKKNSQEKKIKKEKDDLISIDQTTAPDNTSLHTESEEEKEGISPETTSATNVNGEDNLISNGQTTAPDNTPLHMESKAQQDGKSETTDATNEKKTVGDNLISIDQTEALDNTLLHTEGISPKTSDATNENENQEEGISTKSSDASNKKGIGKGGISPKTTSVTNKKEIGKRPLPKPPTKQRNPQNSSTPQIQNLGEVGYHGRIALSGASIVIFHFCLKTQNTYDFNFFKIV